MLVLQFTVSTLRANIRTKIPFPSYGLMIAKLRSNVCKPGSQGLLCLEFRLVFLHVLEDLGNI